MRTPRDFLSSAGVMVAAALALYGCVSEDNVALQPLGAPVATVDGTYPAAKYEIRVGPSVIGDATVRSEVRAEPEPAIDVRVQLENRSSAPVTVVPSGLELRTARAGPLLVPAPVRVSRTADIDSGQTGAVFLAYPLPAGVAPADVQGIRFDWRVHSASGESCESTDFARVALAEHGDVCPGPHYDGIGGPCAGWEQGVWFGYDNPNNPAMPLSRPPSSH